MNLKQILINKQLDQEYKKVQSTGHLLVGLVIGVFGSFAASLFQDLFIPKSKVIEFLYLIMFGGLFIFLIYYIDRNAYKKIHKLEKELKEITKKSKSS